MEHLREPHDGGWIEHALPDCSRPHIGHPVPVGVLGQKSGNAYLHWMEALIDLCAATGDPAVPRSLEEAVDLLSTHFYPADARAAEDILTRDWRPMNYANETQISLGHNVEFAWLLLRAEQVLGRTLSVDRLESYLDHALVTGFDETKGGLDTHPSSTCGRRAAPERSWRVQVELLACLIEATEHTTPTSRYEEVLRQHLAFVFGRQADRQNALWWEVVDEDGRIITPSKHHEWKAGYHELRAITLLSERSSLRFQNGR